jgi:hypothetical protein
MASYKENLENELCLFAGGALGIKREEKLIEHDIDVDLLCLDSRKEKILNALNEWLPKKVTIEDKYMTMSPFSRGYSKLIIFQFPFCPFYNEKEGQKMFGIEVFFLMEMSDEKG